MISKFINKITLLLCIAVVAGIVPSCKKGFFDQVPDNITTYEAIFTSEQKSNEWLARVYSATPDMWDIPYGISRTNPPWTGMTDEVEVQPLWASGLPYPITQGTLTTDNSTAVTLWTHYYQAIRYASIYLKNIDKNEQLLNRPDGNGAQLMKEYKGEARFLRAYYYFQLMKIFGPVPLMGEEPKEVTADFQVPRSTWAECVNYVLSEIDKALQDVADVQALPSQTGRITRGIALAVKSQVLLFDASPLYNGNTEFSDFKNPDGTPLFSQTADPAKWQKAADAAKAVIDLNRWSLYTVGSPATSFTDAFNSTRNLFWDGYQTEGIWTRYSTNLGDWQVHSAPRQSANNGGWNGISAFQELVDAFRMANGKMIDESGSGYTESGFAAADANYYPLGASNMYKGREPRFYAYVTFNGAKSPISGTLAVTANVVGYYNTGNSGKAGSTRDWPPTGYTPKKNQYFGLNYGGTSSNPTRPLMLIRLAEIYLNYAEALNEAQPGNADILLYLNKVRQRGGIAPVTSGSQAEIRKLIRRERRVELCFEGQRYFDVRRWKTPTTTEDHQGGEFYGMNMDAGTTLLDPAFHVRTITTRRAVWSRKDYFWPVPQSETDRNKQLVQFPGY